MLSYLHITGTQRSPPVLSLIFLCFPPAHIHKSKPVETTLDYFDVCEIISLICCLQEEMVQTATSWKCRFDLNMSLYVLYGKFSDHAYTVSQLYVIDPSNLEKKQI